MKFTNHSADEELGYFCEEYSENLISNLSRFRKLFLVSGSISFVYDEGPKKPSVIGQELSVSYLLSGSIRKLGKKMGVSATLISAKRDNAIWSIKFDTTIDKVFDLQGELAEKISFTIVGRVEAESAKQLATNTRPRISLRMILSCGNWNTIVEGV